MELIEFPMNTFNSVWAAEIAMISNLNVELKIKAILFKNTISTLN